MTPLNAAESSDTLQSTSNFSVSSRVLPQQVITSATLGMEADEAGLIDTALQYYEKALEILGRLAEQGPLDPVLRAYEDGIRAMWERVSRERDWTSIQPSVETAPVMGDGISDLVEYLNLFYNGWQGAVRAYRDDDLNGFYNAIASLQIVESLIWEVFREGRASDLERAIIQVSRARGLGSAIGTVRGFQNLYGGVSFSGQQGRRLKTLAAQLAPYLADVPEGIRKEKKSLKRVAPYSLSLFLKNYHRSYRKGFGSPAQADDLEEIIQEIIRGESKGLYARSGILVHPDIGTKDSNLEFAVTVAHEWMHYLASIRFFPTLVLDEILPWAMGTVVLLQDSGRLPEDDVARALLIGRGIGSALNERRFHARETLVQEVISVIGSHAKTFGFADSAAVDDYYRYPRSDEQQYDLESHMGVFIGAHFVQRARQDRAGPMSELLLMRDFARTALVPQARQLEEGPARVRLQHTLRDLLREVSEEANAVSNEVPIQFQPSPRVTGLNPLLHRWDVRRDNDEVILVYPEEALLRMDRSLIRGAAYIAVIQARRSLVYRVSDTLRGNEGFMSLFTISEWPLIYRYILGNHQNWSGSVNGVFEFLVGTADLENSETLQHAQHRFATSMTPVEQYALGQLSRWKNRLTGRPDSRLTNDRVIQALRTRKTEALEAFNTNDPERHLWLVNFELWPLARNLQLTGDGLVGDGVTQDLHRYVVDMLSDLEVLRTLSNIPAPEERLRQTHRLLDQAFYPYLTNFRILLADFERYFPDNMDGHADMLRARDDVVTYVDKAEQFFRGHGLRQSLEKDRDRGSFMLAEIRGHKELLFRKIPKSFQDSRVLNNTLQEYLFVLNMQFNIIRVMYSTARGFTEELQGKEESHDGIGFALTNMLDSILKGLSHYEIKLFADDIGIQGLSFLDLNIGSGLGQLGKPLVNMAIRKTVVEAMKNALRYAKDQQVRARVYQNDANQLVLEIANKGPVISEDQMPHLLKIGYTTHEQSIAGEGRGFGLSRLAMTAFLHQATLDLISGGQVLHWENGQSSVIHLEDEADHQPGFMVKLGFSLENARIVPRDRNGAFLYDFTDGDGVRSTDNISWDLAYEVRRDINLLKTVREVPEPQARSERAYEHAQKTIPKYLERLDNLHDQFRPLFSDLPLAMFISYDVASAKEDIDVLQEVFESGQIKPLFEDLIPESRFKSIFNSFNKIVSRIPNHLLYPSVLDRDKQQYLFDLSLIMKAVQTVYRTVRRHMLEAMLADPSMADRKYEFEAALKQEENDGLGFSNIRIMPFLRKSSRQYKFTDFAAARKKKYIHQWNDVIPDLEGLDMYIIRSDIENALTEFIKNSITASVQNSPIFIRVYYRGGDRFLVMEVENTGNIIPESQLRSILKYHYTGKKQPVSGEGFGLELPIVIMTALLNNAAFELESGRNILHWEDGRTHFRERSSESVDVPGTVTRLIFDMHHSSSLSVKGYGLDQGQTGDGLVDQSTAVDVLNAVAQDLEVEFAQLGTATLGTSETGFESDLAISRRDMLPTEVLNSPALVVIEENGLDNPFLVDSILAADGMLETGLLKIAFLFTEGDEERTYSDAALRLLALEGIHQYRVTRDGLSKRDYVESLFERIQEELGLKVDLAMFRRKHIPFIQGLFPKIQAISLNFGRATQTSTSYLKNVAENWLRLAESA